MLPAQASPCYSSALSVCLVVLLRLPSVEQSLKDSQFWRVLERVSAAPNRVPYLVKLCARALSSRISAFQPQSTPSVKPSVAAKFLDLWVSRLFLQLGTLSILLASICTQQPVGVSSFWNLWRSLLSEVVSSLVEQLKDIVWLPICSGPQFPQVISSVSGDLTQAVFLETNFWTECSTSLSQPDLFLDQVNSVVRSVSSDFSLEEAVTYTRTANESRKKKKLRVATSTISTTATCSLSANQRPRQRLPLSVYNDWAKGVHFLAIAIQEVITSVYLKCFGLSRVEDVSNFFLINGNDMLSCHFLVRLIEYCLFHFHFNSPTSKKVLVEVDTSLGSLPNFCVSTLFCEREKNSFFVRTCKKIGAYVFTSYWKQNPDGFLPVHLLGRADRESQAFWKRFVKDDCTNKLLQELRLVKEAAWRTRALNLSWITVEELKDEEFLKFHNYYRRR